MRPATVKGAMIYLLFFCSGISGLIYQVIWVRVFGNVFGNTIYSASLVVAVFMIGLGAGSYVAGVWADRRYASRPDSMLRAYGGVELVIAVMALAVSALLPHLAEMTSRASSYARGADGWFVLSASSYLARIAIAVVLLTPITVLMGGTLALLIRHLVRNDLDAGNWRIAAIYGINTIGAAAGCFATDVWLVPAYGLRGTQIVAVAFNVVAGIGAFALATIGTAIPSVVPPVPNRGSQTRKTKSEVARRGGGTPDADPRMPALVPLTGLALALSGFAAMGMEIVWFRHFSILLGEFRAVFSLLLAVILIGAGFGSLAGGLLHRRTNQPAQCLIVIQGLFVACTLLGVAIASAEEIRDASAAYADRHLAAYGWARAFAELWFNARPILLVVGVPAVLMGLAFPLANAVIQRTESAVGRRAGVLYLFNTLGAVCGSLVTGFVLLPAFGIQKTATMLTLAAASAAGPLYLATGRQPGSKRSLAVSMLLSALALGAWLSLPADYVLGRALLFPLQRAYTLSEGITELIAVTDGPDGGRVLVTNGHPMSSTELLSQRYMRAMAHIPLLALDNPQSVLVICYGVGNTAQAAALHPTVRRVDVVDLSRHVLEHSSYFKDTNGDVLHDPRVNVYVNDGRNHLQMQPAASYDLITLEPPPIVHAGVAALYSTEFYQTARSRLRPNGYMSQWLPAFGVPNSTILSMVRSFVDVFPNAVLLSGATSNLLLIGTNGGRNEVDPRRLAGALAMAPAVEADLRRLDLGSPREIAGMFVASAATLLNATRGVAPVTDDRPIQEYGKRSLLPFDEGLPMSIVDLRGIATWCPRCFADGKPAPLVEGLDTYLALTNLAYSAPPIDVAQTVRTGATRPVAGSGYLGAIVPDSPQLDAVLRSAFTEKYQHATDLLQQRQFDEAARGFREALRFMPESVEAHNNLGIALASQGRLDEATDQFRQALTIQPGFEDARRNLATALGRPVTSGRR
jgi:spermidine synthase